jgi:hypothetical protein
VCKNLVHVFFSFSTRNNQQVQSLNILLKAEVVTVAACKLTKKREPISTRKHLQNTPRCRSYWIFSVSAAIIMAMYLPRLFVHNIYLYPCSTVVATSFNFLSLLYILQPCGSATHTYATQFLPKHFIFPLLPPATRIVCVPPPLANNKHIKHTMLERMRVCSCPSYQSGIVTGSIRHRLWTVNE